MGNLCEVRYDDPTLQTVKSIKEIPDEIGGDL